MIWVLIAGAAWLAVAAVTALVLARAIHVADENVHSSLVDEVVVIGDDPHVLLRSSADPTSASDALTRRSRVAEGAADDPTDGGPWSAGP